MDYRLSHIKDNVAYFDAENSNSYHAINFNAPELDSEEKLKLNGIQQGISKEVFISKVNSFQGALSCFHVAEK